MTDLVLHLEEFSCTVTDIRNIILVYSCYFDKFGDRMDLTLPVTDEEMYCLDCGKLIEMKSEKTGERKIYRIMEWRICK